jgi:cytochrome c553
MKWVKRILLSLAALALLVVTVIYAWSGMVIRREYAAEQRNILLSSRPEVLAEGERLAQVFGCFRACHGERMEGLVFFESWAVGRIIAPNLTRAMERYTPAELEAIVRQGVRPDGTSIMAMPSGSFATMTDRDLSAILSFIDRYPRQEPDLGPSRIGILPRALLIVGEFEPAAVVAARQDAPWLEDFRDDPERLGEYLARNTCSECHGMEFEGNEGFAPPLVFAKGYALESFKKLLATGVMSKVAKARFALLRDEEVEALYTFLSSR